MAASSKPLLKRLPGMGCVYQSKPWRWRGEWLHHGGGGVCELCVSGVSLAKSLLRECFVPAGTDLTAKLLTMMEPFPPPAPWF